MAQPGSTTIQLYHTSTASTTPSAANLVEGELAVNTEDAKIYTKNAISAVVMVGFGPDAVVTMTNKTLTAPVINGFTGDTSAINIGSGQIVKDTAGNVGVGTSTMTYKLNNNGDYWQGNGSGVEVGRLFNDAGVWHLRASSNVTGLGLGSNGVQRMLITSAGNVEHTNYTKLGTGYTSANDYHPAIKMKILKGTTASTQGAGVNIAHGVTASKIISVSAQLDRGDGTYYPPEQTANVGYQYSLVWGGSNILVINSAANSSLILSKAITVCVMYEE